MTDNMPTPPTLGEKASGTLKTIKNLDEQRPDFPGEHLIVLGAGVLLLILGRRSHSRIARLISAAAGSALIGRAASGRGGAARVAKLLKGPR